MLPKSIASCSFSGMILVPHYYLPRSEKSNLLGVFKVRKVQFKLYLYCTFGLFIQNLLSKYLTIWHGASPE